MINLDIGYFQGSNQYQVKVEAKELNFSYVRTFYSTFNSPAYVQRNVIDYVYRLFPQETFVVCRKGKMTLRALREEW